MSIFAYKITRDFGFAPNPFYSVCTLATCKPRIRERAKVGDWVVGFGSASQNSLVKGKIIFAMQVEKILTFNQYWIAEEYQCKKPVMNGSLKQNYGDNIYFFENGTWKQANSHHSNPDGTTNFLNLNRDTKADAVLISKKYWYFGKDAKAPSEELKDLQPGRREYRHYNTFEQELEKWLDAFKESGYLGEPAKFGGVYERYGGKS